MELVVAPKASVDVRLLPPICEVEQVILDTAANGTQRRVKAQSWGFALNNREIGKDENFLKPY